MTTHGLLAGVLLASAAFTAPAYAEAPAADAAKAPAEGVDVDALWAKRIDEPSLRAAIAAWESKVAANPADHDALLMLTRAWYLLGDAHLVDKTEKIDAWAKSMDWGRTCLAANPAWASKVVSQKEKDSVDVLTKDDAPCAYWLATALGKWGKIQGVAKVLGQLPTVKALIGRVEQLDPEYFHYGPARYWGAYYSASSFTWDEEKSRQYFTASIDGAPYYLATRGLRAENLAWRTKDFALFADDIAAILAFDVTSNPELQPENTLEQRKAKNLWDQRRELFDPAVVDAWEKAHPTP